MKVYSVRVRRVVVSIIGFALGSTAVVALPAQATPGNCFNGTGGDIGAWDTTRNRDFGRGGWCMHDPQHFNYRLVFQNDGNLVAYNNASANNASSAVWSSHTANVGTRLSFQVDGNVVVYDAGGTAKWWTGYSTRRTSSTYFRLYLERGSVNFKSHEVMFVDQYNPPVPNLYFNVVD